MTLLEKVKANLILDHSADDELLEMYITGHEVCRKLSASSREPLRGSSYASHHTASHHHAVVPLL